MNTRSLWGVGPVAGTPFGRSALVRRERAQRSYLAAAGLGHTDAGRTVAVLRAIAGAKALRQDLTPVWTMPGNEATVGHLTSEFHRLVEGAHASVTCPTDNFERTSRMSAVLAAASEQPGVVVIVYLDGDKADAAAVKAQLLRATVYHSGTSPTTPRSSVTPSS